MSAALVAEEYASRVETTAGSPIAITSYCLGAGYFAKAEIHVPGAGARIAAAQDFIRQAAEEKVLAEVRQVLGKKH